MSLAKISATVLQRLNSITTFLVLFLAISAQSRQHGETIYLNETYGTPKTIPRASENSLVKYVVENLMAQLTYDEFKAHKILHATKQYVEEFSTLWTIGIVEGRYKCKIQINPPLIEVGQNCTLHRKRPMLKQCILIGFLRYNGVFHPLEEKSTCGKQHLG